MFAQDILLYFESELQIFYTVPCELHTDYLEDETACYITVPFECEGGPVSSPAFP